MRALILGGHGAIGSAVARHADQLGMETHAVARSDAGQARLAGNPGITRHCVELEDGAAVGALLRAVRPDWIVMAAFPGEHAAKSPASRRLLLGAMVNVLLGVMEAAASVRFGGTITWLGSAMVNSIAKAGAPGDAMDPRTWRGAVKAAEVLLARQFASAHGLRLVELRVFTGYGPFEQPQRLVPALLRAALGHDRVRLAPTPSQRDWIHYADIARACVASIDAGTGTCNLCTGRWTDTRALATCLETITGKPLIDPRPWDGSDHYGRVAPGVPPLQSQLPWSPSISLEDGLRDAWSWAQSRAGRDWLLRGTA
jgi:nucleoside-diphosphate-sugar epimerase